MNTQQHFEVMNRMYEEFTKLNEQHKLSTNYAERKVLRKKIRKLNNQITDIGITLAGENYAYPEAHS